MKRTALMRRDHVAFAVDQLQLGQAQEIARVADVLCGTEAGNLLMLAQECWQLEFFEMMGEQDLWGLAHGRDPVSRLM